MARQYLRDALDCADKFVVGRAIDSVPPGAEAAMHIIRNLPISLWREELPKYKSLLNAVHELQLSYSAFLVGAQNLDTTLTQFVRANNVRRGYAQNMDTHLISYIIARLQGFGQDEILPWINYGIEKSDGWLEQDLNLASDDQQIISKHREYSNLRKILMIKLDALIGELNT